jgi:hypothetical protein
MVPVAEACALRGEASLLIRRNLREPSRTLALGLLAASTAALMGCEDATASRPSSSVRMKLPPAQPAEAKPGFSSEGLRQ